MAAVTEETLWVTLITPDTWDVDASAPDTMEMIREGLRGVWPGPVSLTVRKRANTPRPIMVIDGMLAA